MAVLESPATPRKAPVAQTSPDAQTTPTWRCWTRPSPISSAFTTWRGKRVEQQKRGDSVVKMVNHQGAESRTHGAAAWGWGAPIGPIGLMPWGKMTATGRRTVGLEADPACCTPPSIKWWAAKFSNAPGVYSTESLLRRSQCRECSSIAKPMNCLGSFWILFQFLHEITEAAGY